MRRTTLLLAASALALAASPMASTEPLGVPSVSHPFGLAWPEAHGTTDQASAVQELVLAGPAYASGHTETLLRFQADFSGALGQRVAFAPAAEDDLLPTVLVAGSYFPPGSDGDGFLLRVGAGESGEPTRIDSGLPDTVVGLAVDEAGDALVGGSAYDGAQGRSVFLAAKVSGSTVQWVRTAPLEAAALSTSASDLAVDGDGNTVLAGIAVFPSFDYDAVAAKFDPAGNVQWTKRIALPGTFEYVLGVAVDPRNDDILLAGHTYEGGAYRPLVIRLDPDGNVLARVTVDLGAMDAVTLGIAVGPEGHLFLTGYTFDHGYDALLARLTPALAVDWAQGIRTGGYAIGTDVDVDRHGNAVLGGYALTSLGGYDMFVAKVAPQGATLFTRLIDRLDSGFEVALGVATSPDGLLVATGGYAQGAGGYDLFLTISLGASGAGAASGAANTVLNAPALL